MKKVDFRWLLLLFLGSALFAGIALSENAPEPSFSEQELALLAKGEPVFREEQFKDSKGHRAGRGVAYIHIKAQPQAIWKHILDYDHYAEFYPNIHTAKITKKQDNHYYVFFTLDALGLLKIKYNVDHTFSPQENLLTWKMDQSQKNDFKETTGFWRIWPRPDHTSLVCYSVYVQTGRWVPAFLQKAVDKVGLTTWGLKKVVTCMKKRVEMGSSYKGEPDRKLKEGEI